MDDDQLDKIGKAAAKQLQNRMGFEEISFSVSTRIAGEGMNAGGIMTRAGQGEKTYALSKRRVQALLELSDSEAHYRLSAILNLLSAVRFGV